MVAAGVLGPVRCKTGEYFSPIACGVEIIERVSGDKIMKEKIGIIGAGRVGKSLARALSEAGCSVRAVFDRREERALTVAALCKPETRVYALPELPTDLTMLFIATSDDAIAAIAEDLAQISRIRHNMVVAHTSGALSSAVLAELQPFTENLASFHPVQTFSGADGEWQRLFGIYYGLEGSRPALARLQDVVHALKGKSFLIPSEMKTIYHIGCVFASNYLIGLLDCASQIMEIAGFSRQNAIEILEPLVFATLQNVKQFGPENAITGPIVRGDIQTLQRHLTVLREQAPALVPYYQAFGRLLLQTITNSREISPEILATLKELFQDTQGLEMR